MGQYNAGILTTAGQQLITQALAGDGIISFPLAKTSNWAIPAGTNIQALTDLQDIQQTVTPGTAQIFNGTMIQVQALFSNANQGSEVTEAYLVQTVGLWAQITGGEPTLFSVYQATTPDQMPAYAGKAPSSLIYTLQATVQQASQLTVQVNPAGAATALDIQNLQTQITQIETDYIPKTQIGAASGVAGLGTNSAVPIAQGGTGGNTITEALANLGAQPGFNFLVNPLFQYNGRNQQSYTAQAWTVDGWFSPSGSATITFPGGVTVTNAIAVAQPIQQCEQLFGKQATFSVKDADAIYTVTAMMPNLAQGTDAQIAAQATPWGDIAIWNISSLSAFAVVISVSSAATLEAAKLELGATSTLAADLAQGQDEAVEQLRLDLYDLDPGRPAWVLTQNENLLDNAYFVGGGSQQGGGQLPINQRGQTSYTGTGYGIDRWEGLDSSQVVSVLANGISILNSSGNSTIFQTIAQKLINQKVTFSVQQSDGTIDILTNTFTGSGAQIIHQMANGKGQIYLSDGASESGVGILASSGETVTITAAKLELGSRSTLARLVDGKLVLNDPPSNFQQELAKCERYQAMIHASTSEIPGFPGRTLSNSETSCLFFIPMPVEMRVNPTLILDGAGFFAWYSGGRKKITAITNTIVCKNGLVVYATCEQGIGTGVPILVALASGSTALLDANL